LFNKCYDRFRFLDWAFRHRVFDAGASGEGFAGFADALCENPARLMRARVELCSRVERQLAKHYQGTHTAVYRWAEGGNAGNGFAPYFQDVGCYRVTRW
jgi:hypothetical protein